MALRIAWCFSSVRANNLSAMSEIATDKVNRAMHDAAIKRRLKELEQKRDRLRLLQFKQATLQARDKLVNFTCLTMPHPSDPGDVMLSRYQPVRHHHALGAALEEVDLGNILRLIIVMPPRHGKSELASRRFPAFFVGRDPYRQIIFATYNEEFAKGFGRTARDIMRSRVYKHIFPGVELKKGSQSAELLETTVGGALAFVGRGGSITGRGADALLIDDPIKDREEADSKLVRDKLWDWFTDVAMTRLINESARVIIIMTRWHEDDLVGRLTDPKNPHFKPEEAAQWKVLHLAAEALEDDPLGRPKGAPLWPERFGTRFLQNVRRLNSRTYSALYQGRPAPEDGAFFKREGLIGYQLHELPRSLRKYAASDHAVSTKQENDRTCLGCAGIDEDDVLWILPDLNWGRFETDQTVELMLSQIQRHRPITWWAENEHISKSIGPFLRKRMREEHTYCTIEPSSAAKDAFTRAQAIKARISMGMVRFPVFAPWWEDAKEELLKFGGGGKHDDFVSWLAHLGRGLDRMVGARPRLALAPDKKEPPTGSFAWVKWASEKAVQDVYAEHAAEDF